MPIAIDEWLMCAGGCARFGFTKARLLKARANSGILPTTDGCYVTTSVMILDEPSIMVLTFRMLRFLGLRNKLSTFAFHGIPKKLTHASADFFLNTVGFNSCKFLLCVTYCGLQLLVQRYLNFPPLESVLGNEMYQATPSAAALVHNNAKLEWQKHHGFCIFTRKSEDK